MNGRKYAEELVGPLDRSNYNTQRDVAQKSYNTNWENLQNQYKNLQDQLKRKQEIANRDFAEGLINVADRSYDRMSNAEENLANRGLTVSGIRDVAKQRDIEQKGAEIGNLLGKNQDISLSGVERLNRVNQEMLNREAELGKNLGNTLGAIGSRDVNAQMDYGTGLANLANQKEARDFANQMAAKQRAMARASSGGGRRSKESDDLEEFYKRLAINEVLTADDMDDLQKANTLKIMFDKGNADEVVKRFMGNENIEKRTKDKAKEKDKLDRQLKNYKDLKKVYERSLDDYDDDLISNRLAGYSNDFSRWVGKAGLGGQTRENLEEQYADVLKNIKETKHKKENLEDIKFQDFVNLLYQ